MAGLFSFPQRESDESEYAKWLRRREADIADLPQWLELPLMAEAPEAQPRLVQARSGDSISKLLGTSDPGAIGAFARANGLEVGDSKIYAGRTYVLPDDLRTNEDQSRGTMMLRRDNARLDAMRTQQALAAAERQLRAH